MNFREILIRLIAMTTPYVYDQNVSLLELVRRLYSIVNELCIALQGLKDEYDDLKTYVDNYFKNLDLSSEVKTVIDEMVADGTLANLINQDLLGNINNEIANLTTSLNKANEDISAINGNIETINTDITSLKNYNVTNDSNILKLENKDKVQIATCEANSNYVINNENLVVNTNDILYIHFNQAIDNTKQATLTINGVAKNVIKDDGSLFLGSALENSDLILKVGNAGLYEIIDIANLQDSINHANNEINTLNTLYENLQADVTNNTDGIDGLSKYVQFTNKIPLTTSNVVLNSSGDTLTDVSGYIEYNNDYSKLKIQGSFSFTVGADSGVRTLKIQTPIRPSEQKELSAIGLGFAATFKGMATASATLLTSGELQIKCLAVANNTILLICFGSEYEIKNYIVGGV